jgi:NhaP-type Na+/H+ or K+/H+ antiporter
MASEDYLGIETFLLCFLLIVFVFSSVYLEVWKINFIHQTGISILLGLFFGFIIWISTDKTLEFEGEVFFYYILPPIIFAAGYNMKRRRFMRNLGYISLFGILGTLFSFIMIGVGAFLLG